MALNVESFIWYLLLIDSVGAVITSFFFMKWYNKNINRWIVRHFPATKGWSLYYFILIIYIGFLLNRLGIF